MAESSVSRVEGWGVTGAVCPRRIAMHLPARPIRLNTLRVECSGCQHIEKQEIQSSPPRNATLPRIGEKNNALRNRRATQRSPLGIGAASCFPVFAGKQEGSYPRRARI